MVIEDDPGINRGLSQTLKTEGYKTLPVLNGKSALHLLKENPDLIILDINLPDVSGFDLCKEIRKGNSIPIIFLTARESEMDQLKGYTLGCDDYVTKPFSTTLLLLKIKALLKRSGSQKDIIEKGDIVFHPMKKTLYKNNEKISLSSTELKLLTLFITNPGIVLTKEIVMDRIWGCENRIVEENTLTVAINRLRKKIEDDHKKPEYIKTLFGIGFYWDEV